MIDWHSHVLPQIDDGSRSLEESAELLTMLSAQGVKESHHLMDDGVPPIGVQHEIPPSVTDKTELLFDEQLREE